MHGHSSIIFNNYCYAIWQSLYALAYPLSAMLVHCALSNNYDHFSTYVKLKRQL